MDGVAEAPALLEPPGRERPGEDGLHVLAELGGGPRRAEDGVDARVREDEAVAVAPAHRRREAARGERLEEEAPARRRVGEDARALVAEDVEDLALDAAVRGVVAEHQDVGADLARHGGREPPVVRGEADRADLSLGLQLLEGRPAPPAERAARAEPAEEVDVERLRARRADRLLPRPPDERPAREPRLPDEDEPLAEPLPDEPPDPLDDGGEARVDEERRDAVLVERGLDVLRREREASRAVPANGAVGEGERRDGEAGPAEGAERERHAGALRATESTGPPFLPALAARRGRASRRGRATIAAVTSAGGRERRETAEKVSVVVPAHRADDGLRACLASVFASSPAPGEVIVVVDGEAPGCAALAAGARVLATAGGEGPAVARNLGAREAAGEIVLFLDADVVAPPDLVGRVARRLEEDPTLDGVFGSYDAAPAAPGVVSVFRNLLHHHVHQTSRAEAASFWSGCGALRAAVLRDGGGFDEGYPRPSVEDIELGSRLVRGGRRILLDPTLQVKHLKRWTLGGMVVTDVRDRALPWTRLILREGRLPSDLNLAPRHRASGAAVLALVAGLAAAPAWPLAGLLAAAAGLGVLLAANRGFYRLLLGLRGPAFLAAAVPLHALHYLCGAAGFAAGAALHLLAPGRSGRAAALAGPAPDLAPAPVDAER